MAVLHQLMSNEDRALRDCLGMARPGDGILLLAGGVRLLESGGAKLNSEKFHWLASAPDARELAQESNANNAGVSLVEDHEWVACVMKYSMVLSWS